MDKHWIVHSSGLGVTQAPDRPYQEGYIGCFRYGSVADNPYRRADPRHYDWLAGWYDAMMEREAYALRDV
jgi:ribosome modulation factor